MKRRMGNKNLFSLKIGTVRALLELAAVVVITYFQVSKSVVESLDFLFALANLAIQLVTVALEFFLLLGSLDNVVSLRVLARGFSLTS